MFHGVLGRACDPCDILWHLAPWVYEPLYFWLPPRSTRCPEIAPLLLFCKPMGSRLYTLILSIVGALISLAIVEWSRQSSWQPWEVNSLLGLTWLLFGILAIQRLGAGPSREEPGSQLLNWVTRFEQLSFEAGAEIVKEGDPAEQFYILSKGRVRVHRADEYGAQIELGELVPGDYFGEIGLLTGLPRTASVTALEPVEVLSVTAEEFAHLMQDSRQLKTDLHQTSMERFKGRDNQ